MAKEKIKQAPRTAPEKPERFIYLGPNLLKAGLQTYHVFKGGKPLGLDELKKQHSLIEQLFAEINDANELMQAVKTKGTPAYLAYEQIVKGGNE